MHRLVILLVLVACRRAPDAAPPCGAVGAKFLVIARAELDAAKVSQTDVTRRAVQDQLPAMRDSIVHACTDSAWGGSVRSCFVAAATHVAFEACQQQLTEEQRRSLDRSSRGETDSQ